MKKVFFLFFLFPVLTFSQQSIRFTDYAPNAFNTLWRVPGDFNETASSLALESRFISGEESSYFSEYFKGTVAFGEKTEFKVILPYHFFDHNFSDSTQYVGQEIGDIDLIFNLKIFSSDSVSMHRFDWFFTGEFTTAPTASTYFQTTDKLRMLGSLNLRYLRSGKFDYGLIGGFASGGWDDYTGPNQKHFLRTNISAFLTHKLCQTFTLDASIGGFYLVAEGKNNTSNSYFANLLFKSNTGWEYGLNFKRLNLGISPRRIFNQYSLAVKIPLSFKL